MSKNTYEYEINCIHVSLLFQVDAVAQSIPQVEHTAHSMHSGV